MKFIFDNSKLPIIEKRIKKNFYKALIIYPIVTSLIFEFSIGIFNVLIFYALFQFFIISVIIWTYISNLKTARTFKSYYIELTYNHLVVSKNHKYLNEIHYSLIENAELKDDVLIIKMFNRSLKKRVYASIENNEQFIRELKKQIRQYQSAENEMN